MNHTALFIDGFKAGLRGHLQGRTVTGTREGNLQFKRGLDAGHALRRDLHAKAIEMGNILRADEYIRRIIAKIDAGDLRALDITA